MLTIIRRSRAAALAAALFAAAWPAGAARAASLAGLPPVVGAAELYSTDRTGLGLLGFDPVSYFLPDGPKPGSRAFELLWNGTAWRFASEANREAFKRDPESYAPRVGGYDAVSAAAGIVVDADPGLFLVRPTGLYLFRTDQGRTCFRQEAALAAAAEAGWSTLSQNLVQP